MITAEAELLEGLAERGFDFTSTVCDIAARFPRELDWGVPHFEVLPFCLTRPFTAPGERSGRGWGADGFA